VITTDERFTVSNPRHIELAKHVREELVTLTLSFTYEQRLFIEVIVHLHPAYYLKE
jgi:hypothetical protein